MDDELLPQELNTADLEDRDMEMPSQEEEMKPYPINHEYKPQRNINYNSKTSTNEEHDKNIYSQNFTPSSNHISHQTIEESGINSYNYSNLNNLISFSNTGNANKISAMNNLDSNYLNKSYTGEERQFNEILSANNLLNSKGSKSSNSNTNFYQKSPAWNPHSDLYNNYNTIAHPKKSDEPNFETSLRNYIGVGVKNRNENKIFKNYTKVHGDFFDPTLQKGGRSKFNDGKARSKSKTRTNPPSGITNSSNSYSQFNLASPAKSYSSKGTSPGYSNYSSTAAYQGINHNYKFQFSD
jgi:hypothetical protein